MTSNIRKREGTIGKSLYLFTTQSEVPEIYNLLKN